MKYKSYFTLMVSIDAIDNVVENKFREKILHKILPRNVTK